VVLLGRKLITEKEWYDADWEGILERGEEYQEELYRRRVEGVERSKLWLQFFYRRRDEIVYSIAKPLLRDGWSILDIGCGVSLMARIADKAGKGVKVTGLDISTSVLEENRKRWPDHEWIEGNAADPPFDEQFDLVLSTELLEHLTDRVEAMHNWFELVKPGGYFILTTPTPTMKIPNGPHLGFESLGTVRKVMGEHGIRMVESHGIGLFLPLQAKVILSMSDPAMRNRVFDWMLRSTYRFPTLSDDVVYVGRRTAE
jgi:2-polyprenyl-3-methyl-5-hydroxy-6-metoxy-1,4-benzoquinol methylase